MLKSFYNISTEEFHRKASFKRAIRINIDIPHYNGRIEHSHNRQ